MADHSLRCGALAYDMSQDVRFVVGHKTLRKATSSGLPSGLVNLDLDVGKMVWWSGRVGARMACNGEAWVG